MKQFRHPIAFARALALSVTVGACGSTEGQRTEAGPDAEVGSDSGATVDASDAMAKTDVGVSPQGDAGKDAGGDADAEPALSGPLPAPELPAELV